MGTSAAILDRVEPLCRALLPEQGTLHFTMSPQVSHLKTGQRRSFWLVECLDAQDRHLVHVLWDATSSRVVMIGRSESFEDMPAMRGRHTIDSTHALDRAREWAHTLHLASRAELAASAHKLIPEGDVICVRLFPSSGEVIVWVSSRTGAILNTHVHNGYDHPADPHNSRYIAAKHPDPPHA